MILIIDNYDSFTHNLARYIREEGGETRIVRNDVMSAEACLAMNPAGIVVSPGPDEPAKAGISLPLIERLPCRLPFLGVCLGHQCLVEVFGGETQRAKEPLHGMATGIAHTGEGVFRSIPSPTSVGRYHSLISILPEVADLKKTAWSRSGEVMAVAHKTNPWFGVQFHPESLMTTHGRQLIGNFVALCAAEPGS